MFWSPPRSVPKNPPKMDQKFCSGHWDGFWHFMDPLLDLLFFGKFWVGYLVVTEWMLGARSHIEGSVWSPMNGWKTIFLLIAYFQGYVQLPASTFMPPTNIRTYMLRIESHMSSIRSSTPTCKNHWMNLAIQKNTVQSSSHKNTNWYLQHFFILIPSDTIRTKTTSTTWWVFVWRSHPTTGPKVVGVVVCWDTLLVRSTWWLHTMFQCLHRRRGSFLCDKIVWHGRFQDDLEDGWRFQMFQQPFRKNMSQNGFIFPNFQGEHSKIIWIATTCVEDGGFRNHFGRRQSETTKNSLIFWSIQVWMSIPDW